VTYTPNADFFGSDSFTFTVNDGTLTSAPGTVSITVDNINDAPSFTKGADQTVNEDAGLQTVVGWATAISAGPNEAGQAVDFIVTNDNNGLFSGQPAVSPTGTLTYTPAANQSGSATVSVQIHDDGGTANGGVDTSAAQTFTITVTAVNDAPSFTKGADQTVLEDAGAQTVLNWASAISPGPADEAGQAVDFIVTNDNNGLFSAQPAVSPTGTLTYTPAADQFGSATVSVQIHDNGGTANGGVDTSAVQTFTITVTGVNDAPSFTKGPDQVVNEDAGLQTVVGWATAISPGPNESGQAVNFIVSNNNNPLFSAQPAVSPTGALTYTPAANKHGVATVSVQIHDNGGTADGGVDTSAVQTFTITVTAVNDPPTAQAQSYTAQANMQISIAAGSGLLVGAADAADVAGNAGYTPTFTVGTVNGVAPVAGVITSTVAGVGTFTVTASTGAFSFEPAAGVTGPVSTTYTVCDSGDGAPASQCSATAQLQFTMNAPVIWFVAPNLGANGTGTLANPFNVLASANTAKGANANHRIFVYHSMTPATGVTTEAGVGVTLDAAGSQQLVGQGVTGASFDTIMGLTGPNAVPAGTIARPGINGTRPVIQGTVAMSGNSSVVRGLNITPSAAGAQGLTGGAVTGVTVGEVSVAATTGTAVNLNGTGGTVSLNDVSTTTATAVSITGGTGTVTVDGAVSRTGSSANAGISVASRGSGTVTFSGATKTLNTGTGAGVSLSGNSGATINFSNGGLDVDTTSGAGFSATGGGTVNVSGSNNTVISTTGTAVNLNGVGGAISLTSVSANTAQAAGASNGIAIQNTLAGFSFTVDGDGSNTTVGGNGSGGTISRMEGGDGAVAGNGVYLSSTQNVTLRRMTINGTNQNHAIRGISVNGFHLEYSTISGTNGTTIGLDEGTVVFDNMTGTSTITSSILEGGLEENLNVVNTAGTLNLTIAGSTFGFNSTASGNNNILLESQNAGTTLNFTLQSSLIKGARADFLNASNNSGSTMSATIGGSTPALGNTFDNLGANAHPNAAAGGNRVVLGAVGPLTFDINRNTLKGSKGEAIRVRSTATGATTGTGNGHVRNNTIGVAATANSGSSESFGIFIFGDGGSDMIVAVTNNDISQYNNHGISFTFGDEINNGSSFSATVTGNTVHDPGNINTDFNAIHLNNGTVGATDDFTTCFSVGGSTVAEENDVAGGGQGVNPPNNNDIRLRQRQSTTVQLPGYGGASNDNTAVQNYVAGRNNLTTVNASNTVPTGGGFVNTPGGAPCTLPTAP
jgi:hypothetical protein